MTREEAVACVNNRVFGLTDTGVARKWVDTLEALGLIKFEEEKDTRFVCNGAVMAYQVIAKLENLGYTVKRNNGENSNG